MKKITSIILLIAMLASVAACGEQNDKTGDETTASSEGSETTADESAYKYADLDCNGEEFTILNTAPAWNMYTDIDFENMTGESVDDAVYNRNRMIEDKYKFKLNVVEYPLTELAKQVQTTVSADDDTYNAAYVRGWDIASTISNGYARNLYDVPGLQLDQPWWNQSVIKEASLGKNSDTLYFAMSELSLCAFDLTWCIFFNEDMMTDLGQKMPYDLVREGKWTLDSFSSLLKVGANLNGADTFTYKVDASTTYGLTSFYRICDALTISTGNRFVQKDFSGNYALSLENDHYYDTIEKLAKIFGTEGDYYEGASASGTDSHYEKVFKDGRALFMGGEIKAASSYRDMSDSFGILPTPKFDENQEDYCSWMNYDVPTLMIPASNRDLERTGIILDALSYHSYTDIMPIYYGTRVSLKSLRNDDSIEMLGIIRDSLYYDASLTYGWTADIASAIRDAVIAGDSSVASIIATNKSAVAEKIEQTMNSLGQ